MFPSKNMVDYLLEMNRLFPGPDDMMQANAYSLSSPSPFNSTITNQSSSSTDSTSPESFPEISMFQSNPSPKPSPQYASTYDRQGMAYDTPRAYETPKDSQFLVRRQRPIVGRKIFTDGQSTSTPNERVQIHKKVPEYYEYNNNYIDMIQRTPPNANVIQKTYNQNVFYELFPQEKEFEFRSPVKTSPTASNVSTASPIQSSPSQSPLGHIVVYPPPLSPNPHLWPSTSRYNQDVGYHKTCTFCKKNGETPNVYMTHSVKERVGDTWIVSCPILRSHVCSTCGESGDNAHTMTYCPVLRSGNNGRPLRSTTITLKNTRVKSNGRRRY